MSSDHNTCVFVRNYPIRVKGDLFRIFSNTHLKTSHKNTLNSKFSYIMEKLFWS